MSDVNANIGINFDTDQALASLRQLQAGLSRFNQSLTQGNIAAANAQKGLNDQLIQAINSTGKFTASQKTIATSTASFTSALEKNQLSMREYVRFTAAAATANTKTFTGMFAAEREIFNRARKDRVKSLQTQYIQLTNANGELVKVLQVVPKHLQSMNGQYTDYATRVQMAAQRQQMMNQLLKQGSTQLLNFGKNTQWAGRQLMVGITVPLTLLGSVAAKAFQEMEMATVAFSRVYGNMTTSGDATDKAIADVQRLAKEFTKFGIAAKETIEMAAKAAAMGLQGDNLMAQIKQATRLAVLGQVEQQQALETTISLQNAFGISSEDLAKKINFLNAVENQTVLSIEDLTIAIPKAAPIIKQLGGNVEDLAFFMTAMKEGGINAAEGANALKSGLASMINPSKKASEFLADFGINIKGLVDNNAGNLKGTVVGIARALDTLDPLNRARAIEQMFGKFQFSRISTLFQNIVKDGSQASTALNLASASVEELAILSERELGKVENAVSVKFKKQMEQLKIQIAPVGKAFMQALTPILGFVTRILERFNGFSDGTKKTIAIVVGVLGGLAPIALMTFGVLANGLANLIKFFAMLRGGAAKLNGATGVLGGGFDYLTQQEIENLAQSQALHTSHKELISTFNVETAAANQLAIAYGNAASQARSLAMSAPSLFNAVPGAAGAVSGLPKKFATGGVVPGTGNQDTVPAMLTPGEVVLTKDTVKKNPEIISALMNDSVKKYSKGTGKIGADGSTITFGGRDYNIPNKSTPQSANVSLIAELSKFSKDIVAVSRVLERLEAEAASAGEGFKKLSSTTLKKALEDEGAVRDRPKGTSGTMYNGEPYVFAHAQAPGEAVRDPKRLQELADMATSKESGIGKHLQSSADAAAAGDSNGYIRSFSNFGFMLPAQANKGKMAPKDVAANFTGDDMAISMAPLYDQYARSMGMSLEDALNNPEIASQMHSDMKTFADGISREVSSVPSEFLDDPEFYAAVERARAGLGDTVSEMMHNAIADAKATSVVGTFGGEANRGSEGQRVALADKEELVREELGASDSAKPYRGRNKEFIADVPKISDSLDKDLTRAEVEIAESASPSKRTKRLGKDIADGLASGLKEGEAAVKTQSDQLAEAALPSAAETQARVDKMDINNKAFYDDIDTPEMRDERQVLKSLDRNRRKRGAKGRVGAPSSQIQDPVVSSGNISITRNTTIINQERDKADKLNIEASRLEGVAAKARAEAARWVLSTVKGRKKDSKTSKNAADLEKIAVEAEKKAAQLRIKAAKAEEKAAKLSAKDKDSSDSDAAVQQAKGQAREAGKTRKAQRDATKSTEELARAQKKNAQEAANAADTAQGTAETSVAVLDAQDQTAQTQEQINAAKQQELEASGQVTQATRRQADGILTGTELANATEQNLRDSVANGDKINQAEQDKINAAHEEALLMDQIYEKDKEELRLKEGIVADLKVKAAETKASTGKQSGLLSEGEALDQFSTFIQDENGQVVMGKNGPKRNMKMVRGMRAEKVSKYSGKAAGALGTAAMVAGMAGAPPQVTAGLGAAATVAQFAPMITKVMSNPYTAAAAALVAVAGSAYLLNKKLEATAIAIAKFTRSTTVGADLLKKIGEQTGKVGANEAMNRRRGEGSLDLYTDSRQRQGQKDATTFLQGDAGKALQTAYSENATKNGQKVAAKQFALQIAAAISDGTIAPDLGSDIAYQMGVNLKDATTGIDINANLRSLIGVDGEDLMKDPLTVRMRIARQSAGLAKDIKSQLDNKEADFEGLGTGWTGSWWGKMGVGIVPQIMAGASSGADKSAALSVAGSSAIETAQAQADAMSMYYDNQLATLKNELAATTNKQKQLEIQEKITAMEKLKSEGMARSNNLVAAQLTQQENIAKGLIVGVNPSGPIWDDAARRQDAYFDAQKADVKAKYANTAYSASAERVLKIGSKADQDKSFQTKEAKERGWESQADVTKRIETGRTFEAKLNLIMQSGQMNPDQLEAMAKIFEGKLDKMDVVLNVGIRQHGGAKMAELTAMLTGIKKPKAQAIIMTMARRNPKEFDKTANALAVLKRSDGLEIDMAAYIDTVGLPGLTALGNKLDEIQKMPDPIKKEAFIEWAAKNNIDVAALTKDWDYFEKMPDDVRKEALITYTTLYNTMMSFGSQEAYIEWAKEQAAGKALLVGAEGSSKYIIEQERILNLLTKVNGKEVAYNGPEMKAVADAYSLEGTKAIFGDNATINANAAAAAKLKKDKAPRDTTYDDLMKRLRDLRNSAINAAGGFKELEKAIARSGAKAVGNQFNGIVQQLTKGGANQEFIDFITGLDPEKLPEFAKRAGKAGTRKVKKRDEFGQVMLNKKGKPIMETEKYKAGDYLLTEKGKDYKFGLDQAISGQYNADQLKKVTALKQEEAARARLAKLGYTNSQIQEMISDESYRTAVATGKINDAQIKINAGLTREAEIRAKINGLFQNVQDKQQALAETKQIPQLIQWLTAKGVELSVIQEAVKDPTQLSALVAGMNSYEKAAADVKLQLDGIVEDMKNIPDQKRIDIVMKQTNLEKITAGRDAANTMFDAYRKIDENTIKNDKGNTYAGLEKQIAAESNNAKLIQDRIAILDNSIKEKQKVVDRAVESIGLLYDGQIKTLNDAMSDRAREIEIKFDRPMGQLQDRSSKLSHDMDLINHAAEEINKQYDDQAEALNKVSEINQQIVEQQKQQLDLADALSSGDIAAAAKAAQAMRAGNIAANKTTASAALEQGRANAIGGLRSESGMSAEDITKQQWDIGQQVYALEQLKAVEVAKQLVDQDKLYDLEQKKKDALDLQEIEQAAIDKIIREQLVPLQDSLDISNAKVANLTLESDLLLEIIDKNDREREISELTREEWDQLVIAAQAASDELSGDMALALAAAKTVSGNIKTDWVDIKDLYDKIVSKSIIITQKIVTEGGGDPSVPPVVPPPVVPPPGADDTPTKSPGKAWIPDGKGGWKKPPKPTGDYGWSDTNGWVKGYAGADTKGSTDSAAEAKLRADALIRTSAANAEAAAKALAAKQSDYDTLMAGVLRLRKDGDNGLANAAMNRLTAKYPGGRPVKLAKGGLIDPMKFLSGGFSVGRDTVPAMLTPGEFVMSKYAVENFGVNNLKAINSGSQNVGGDSVYNYSVTVNASSNALPQDIARTVMNQIKEIDSQRIQGVRL